MRAPWAPTRRSAWRSNSATHEPWSPAFPLRGPQPGDPLFETQYDDDAVECYVGIMAACDDLYWDTPAGSYYEWYGSTCGGRLGYESSGECVAILGPSD